MAKSIDKVVKETEEYRIVEFTAKKGKGTCKQFKSLEAAVEHLTDDKCLMDINRQVRTDAINTVNREISDAAILKKAAKENPEIQKELDRILAMAKNH